MDKISDFPSVSIGNSGKITYYGRLNGDTNDTTLTRRHEWRTRKIFKGYFLTLSVWSSFDIVSN